MNNESPCTGIIMPCSPGCPRAGYGFVPVQDVDRLYDYESAFASGTVFPDLSIPKGQYGPNEDFQSYNR